MPYMYKSNAYQSTILFILMSNDPVRFGKSRYRSHTTIKTNVCCLYGQVTQAELTQADLTQGPVDPDSYYIPIYLSRATS